MSKQSRKVVRSAKSGRFAAKSKAKTAPASHVTETVAAGTQTRGWMRVVRTAGKLAFSKYSDGCATLYSTKRKAMDEVGDTQVPGEEAVRVVVTVAGCQCDNDE